MMIQRNQYQYISHPCEMKKYHAMKKCNLRKRRLSHSLASGRLYWNHTSAESLWRWKPATESSILSKTGWRFSGCTCWRKLWLKLQPGWNIFWRKLLAAGFLKLSAMKYMCLLISEMKKSLNDWWWLNKWLKKRLEKNTERNNIKAAWKYIWWRCSANERNTSKLAGMKLEEATAVQKICLMLAKACGCEELARSACAMPSKKCRQKRIGTMKWRNNQNSYERSRESYRRERNEMKACIY